MLIEEIDMIGPQTLQAGVCHCFDVLGPAIRPAPALARLKIDVEAELGGDRHLVADRLERLAHQLFIREWPVGFGGIEVRDAKVVCGTNQLDHLALVGCRAIGRAHAHAAEAESRDFEIFSESTLLHCFSCVLCDFFATGLRDLLKMSRISSP